MGNLFSDNRKQEEERRAAIEANRRAAFEADRKRRIAEQELSIRIQRQRQLEEEQRRIALARLRSSIRGSIVQPNSGSALVTQQARSTPALVDHSFIQEIAPDWIPMNSYETVKFVNLVSDSQEYDEIEQLFRNTNKWFFQVSRIERIQNPYLYGAYLLKKEEAENRFGYTTEELLFHGTKKEHINDICSDNFDWRRHGKGTGHRFGQGVSFTPISNYATHYCDKRSNDKCMIVAKVLVSRACIGNGEMIIPPTGFDTSQKDNGHVIVKYDDNEFYPAYKIHFINTTVST